MLEMELTISHFQMSDQLMKLILEFFFNEQTFVKLRCAVYGYNTNKRSKNNFKFFGFPNDEKLKAKWRHLCKREDTFSVNNARICSNHFVDEDYERNLRHELLGYQPKRFRSLKKEDVPSKNLSNREKNPSKSDRVRQKNGRTRKLWNKF
ncbi:hypothetical protein NQ318_003248 [Aromia moschata]|uniref:THAP-type domain-containing protein n=1 Tax=Aromia moschata TaxID=1265417 RepID=A0AAV8XRD5_9CUCU|nr:hypothetical protein NQ318_003248 [Aromia moschata]